MAGAYTPTPAETLENIAAGRDPSQAAEKKPAQVSGELTDEERSRMRRMEDRKNLGGAPWTDAEKDWYTRTKSSGRR